MSIDLFNNGGILKTIKKEGKNDSPSNGCKVKVHYTGTLKSDGKKFDSSRDRNTPFEFNLGKKEVIRGWDDGIKTMKRGEIAVFELQPRYAYGEKGSPPSIPPNAILVFEVELLDWDDTNEEPVMKILKDGTGNCCPIDGAKITVSYTLECKGVQVGTKDNVVTYVGDGDIFKGVETQVQEMRKGQVSSVVFKNSFALSREELEKKKIVFEKGEKIEMNGTIELIDFEELKFDYEFDSAEKVQRALELKTQGNGFFKTKNFGKAKKRYEKARILLKTSGDFEKEQLEKRNGLFMNILMNLSAILLSQKKYAEVVKFTSEGLHLDPLNVKGLYRRAKAHYALKKYEESVSDLTTALSVDSSNKSILKELKRAKIALKKENDIESEVFGRMFS